MKKILVFILLLVSTTAFSQTQWSTYRNQLASWDTYTKKWVYEEMNYANIVITFSKTYISMSNRAESYYRIIEDNGDKTGYTDDYVYYKAHSWVALDNRDRRCVVSMIKYDGDKYDIVFSVMYDDMLFKYYYSPSKTDRFNQ